MKFKFCDIAHYSAMEFESFLQRNKIKFIKDETTGTDQVERLYDITIMSNNITINAFADIVNIDIYSEDTLITSTQLHITDFSTLKIF